MKQEISLDNKKVLAVGRLTREKGFDLLITAWNIVHRQHPDWVLNIYGEGELHDTLQYQIKTLNLNHSVIINPPVKNIEQIYHNHSIFVLSSLHEGFGLVICEAMASGLPCVSFNCQHGPEELIQNEKNGFLVDLGNTHELANRIIKLIENKNLRHLFSEESIKTAEKYSVPTIMKQWIDLFNKLKKHDK